jgi:hypothetical protein
MLEGTKSPEHYGSEIYSHLVKKEPDFGQKVNQEQFLNDIQDERYSSQIYDYLTRLDRSFANGVTLDDFVRSVKKKDAVATASAGGDTLSVLSENEELSPEALQALNSAAETIGAERNPWKPDDPFGQQFEQAVESTEALVGVDAEEREKEIELLREAQVGLEPVQDIGNILIEDANGYPQYRDELIEDLRTAYGGDGFRFEGGVSDGRGDITVISDYFPEPRSFTLRVRSGLIPPQDKVALQEFLNENRAPSNVTIEDDTRGNVEKALRAQEIRPVGMQNSDGSISSHLMEYAEVDGKYVVYPTLFPNRPNSISRRRDMWSEMPSDKALEEAYRRQETFTFDTEEEAKAFAAGSWKETETIDLEGERLYSERGRDYYTEQEAVRRMDDASDEYSFIEQLVGGETFEGEIPLKYQKFFVDGNVVRTDINEVRKEVEARADYLYQTINAEDAVRLREDFDVLLGKKQEALSNKAAEINQAARVSQDKIQVESLRKYGVRVGDLLNYTPKSQEEFEDINYIIGKFNGDINDRMLSAKAYEKAQLYYSKKHNKQVTDDYVDFLGSWGLEWDKAMDRGDAMALLLKTNMGMYEEEEEMYVSQAVSRLLDEDDARLTRKKTRVNETATSSQYWSSLARNPQEYTVAIMAESMGQLLPLASEIVPYFAAAGAVQGGLSGMASGPYGVVGGAAVGALAGAAKAAFLYGMPLSEVALEMGNSIIDVGNERGYDWTDPQQALLAFNDDEVWSEGTTRGVLRGVPIALASYISNSLAGRVFTSSALSTTRKRIALGLLERATIDPTLEMAGEYGALVASGKYTGSVSDMREIVAEGLGAIGQSTPMYAINIATERFKNGNFELAMRLVDPKVLAEEKVDGKRILEWTNRMETMGQVSPDVANFIRKNVGFRREANEILGRKPNARPGFKSKKLARLMELLEAKESLTRSASVREVFKNRIAEINEEIAYIAENNALPESSIADLNLVNERTQRDKPAGYKIGRKAYTRAAFVNELEKRTAYQLRKASVVGDPVTAQLLKSKQDAVQKSSTKKVPTRDESSPSPEVGEEVQDYSEATEQDVQAEEEGRLTGERRERIISDIARKLNNKESLTEVEKTIYENNKDEIEGFTNDEGTYVPGVREEILEVKDVVTPEEEIPPGEITPEEEVTVEEEVTPEEVVTPEAETTVEETVEVEPTVDEETTEAEPAVEEEPTTVEEVAEAIEEELMPELTKRQLAKLLKERPNLRVRYYMKDGGQYIRYTVGYNRSTGKYFFSDGDYVYRGSEYNMFSKALERFLYQHNKAKGGVTGAGFIGLYDDNLSFGKPLAKFDFEMNNITEAEPTVEEETTVEEVTPEPAVEEAPTVEEEAEPTAEEEKPKTYKEKLAEMTPDEKSNELGRRNRLALEAKREGDSLKGKNDKPSRQRRKELKEFMDNLNTMLVDEALALRVEELQEKVEPTMEEDPFLAVLTEPYRVIEQASTAKEIYREIYSTIKDGGLVAKKVYEAMSKNTNLDEVQRAIAKSLAEKLDESVKIRGNARLRTYGYYFYNYSRTAGDVTVSRIELKNPKDELKFDTYVETLLHEGVHAATSLNYLGGKPEFRVEMDRIVSLVKKHLNGLTEQEIRSKYPELHLYLRKGAKIGRRSARAYRMDPEEIMAWGLTNPEMQALMKSIKDPKGESVWSSFVTAIRELMGLAESENTAFDSLLTAYEGSYAYRVGETIDPDTRKAKKSAMASASYIGISDALYRASIYYGLNTNGFIPDNALQKDVNAFKAILEQNGLTLSKAKNGSQYVSIKNTRVPYDLYSAYDIQTEELEREQAEVRAQEEAAQREQELDERVREIYDADDRPYTGRDFDDSLGSASVGPESLVDPADSIVDIVIKGRSMGYRDAAIRAVLIDKFGKENVDAINTAMAEYYNYSAIIPEAFGNVQGGIQVGREIYNEVQSKLDAFLVPKLRKPKRLTKKTRAERIALLRKSFPKDKALSDTQLLRKHKRSPELAPPPMAEVRAKALNLLTENEKFKAQPKEVRERLVVAFDKALNTRSNKQVRDRITRIKRDIREQRRGAKNLKRMQNELRALIRETLPKTGYKAAQVNRLIAAVVNTNEDTILKQAEKVLAEVEKTREKMRDDVVKDILKFVIKSKSKYRTKSGRVRTRSLDADGLAYFEAMLPVIRAIQKKDFAEIESIRQQLSNSTDLLIAIEQQKNGEKLTSKERRLLDKASAFDLLSDIYTKPLEEVEAIYEDLKISAGFSRVALKNTRLARAARYKVMNEEASASLAEEFPFLTNPDGTAMDRNQISAMRNRINQQLRSGQYAETLKGVKGYMMLWTSEGIGKSWKQLTNILRSLGTMSNKLSPYLYENVYNAINRMDEQYQVGRFEQMDILDEIANSVEGVTNGYRGIVSQLYDNQTKNIKVKSKDSALYDNVFNKDQLLRVYALYQNEVQRKKLNDMGFTPEVMAEVEEFLGKDLTSFADTMVQYLSTSYYESINDVYRSVNDIDLPSIKNYFPTRTITPEVQQDLIAAADFNRVFDAETSPALKERTDTTSDVDLSHNLNFSQTLNDHIEQMERYKAYAEGTKQINYMFKNKHLDAVLNVFHLNEFYRQMVNQAINPNSARNNVLKSVAINKLLSGFSRAVLGFKLFQIPKQLSSFITAFQEYQYNTENRVPIIDPIIDRVAFMAEYASIMPAVLLDLGKVLTGNTPKGPVYEAVGVSKTFARRLEQFKSGNIYTLESGVTTFRSVEQQENAMGKFIKGLKQAQAAPIMIGDAGAIMAYLVTYRRSIKNGMDPDLALQQFNDYNITQQSRRPGDKVPAQYSGNVFLRTYIMFGSSIIGLQNNAIVGWQNIMRDVRKGNKPKRSDVRRVWLSVFAANILFTLVANSAIFLLSDDDDERRKAVQDAMLSPLNGFFMIPVFGGIAEQVLKNKLYGYRVSGDGSVDVLARTYNQMDAEFKKDNYTRGVLKALELILGTNIDPFIGVYDMFSGEDTQDATYEALGIPKTQRPD